MHSQPSNSGSGPRPKKRVAAAASLESAKPNSTASLQRHREVDQLLIDTAVDGGLSDRDN
ncbi:MAG: hypothetical protein ACI89G_002430 [Minisyncoccia bacterium]|jgi:hypothetical protein